MRIITMNKTDTFYIEQAAMLLVQGFQEHWPKAWPDLPSALEEVTECLHKDRICRIALDDGGHVLGWIGGIPQYDGNVWELHPVVVDKSFREQGMGRALVADLEEQVRQRGGLTIRLGSDDEDNMTSLAGVDLYDNLWGYIQCIQNFNEYFNKCNCIKL